MLDEITNPFPNFSDATVEVAIVEVQEKISNLIPCLWLFIYAGL